MGSVDFKNWKNKDFLKKTFNLIKLYYDKIMKKTWTRNDIIEAITDNVGLSLSDSSKIIEEIFEFILNELEKGDDVKISSFGTFSVRHKKSRIGRNPKTGIEVPISERNVVLFKPSKDFKNFINSD